MLLSEHLVKLINFKLYVFFFNSKIINNVGQLTLECFAAEAPHHLLDLGHFSETGSRYTYCPRESFDSSACVKLRYKPLIG